MCTAETEYGPVRIKSAEGYGVKRSKCEYEDLAALARANGKPCGKLKRVLMKTRKTNKISDNTIRRLTRYLRCLDELERQGNTRVSSAMIGNHLNNTPSQVRQDLSQFGSYGMQGYGYNIESLRASIHAI